MAAPLRAFLMIRSGADDWNVQVFRDLDELTATWAQNREGATVTGAIHVGFQRPPTRSFEALAERFGGHVLLTAAARYSLPGDFVSSSSPVGEVEGQPVFLALRGWGYEIDDLDAVEVSRPLASPTDWVADFLTKNPAAEAALSEANIVDEDTYLFGEASLEFDIRREIGLFRYWQRIGSDASDPCAVARAAPPWLRAREFASMGTSVRIWNVFVTNQILTVADLDKLTLAELLRTPNFGRKSVGDLLTCLDQALVAGPYDTARRAEAVTDVSLLAAVRRSLLSYGDRERDILSRRMGLDGPPQTLAEIGEIYDITRERIRQIEAKTTKRLIVTEFWDDLLTEKLRKLLRDREFPLPLSGVEAVDPWFAGVAGAPLTIRYILANMCNGVAGIVQVDGVDYFGFLDQTRWDATLLEGRRLLSAGVDKAWSEDHCRVLIGGLLMQEAAEFRGLLWDKAAAVCHFVADSDGVRRLRAYGKGAEHVVEAVLEAAESPLHFTEIAERASTRAKRPIDVRRAHNAAAAVGLLLGRGVYGMPKHIPLDSVSLETLADEAEHLIREGVSGRQWHSSEILAGLSERGSVTALQADKYILDVALRNSGDLASLGRMVWVEKTDATSDTARIDIRQAVVSVLQQAGRPLRTSEVRQRLIALRGVDQHLQIFPSGELIRVGPGRWGLNDRDVPIKLPDQPSLLEAMFKVLRDRDAGIHASELDRFLPLNGDLTAEVVFSLAALDPRLRVSAGQYLYLQEWGEPRRTTVFDAVRGILEDEPGGLDLAVLTTRVQTMIGRACERTTVSASLQGLGAKRDASGRWHAARDSAANEEQPDCAADLKPE